MCVDKIRYCLNRGCRNVEKLIPIRCEEECNTGYYVTTYDFPGWLYGLLHPFRSMQNYQRIMDASIPQEICKSKDYCKVCKPEIIKYNS